jgi:2-amino-4-hydroxy-6-hydroxymethyldihydropteridine diphosphokinase
MAIAYIGLGSNLGDREKNIKEAITRLASSLPAVILKKSSIIETEPVDFKNQPRFLNQVIMIETPLAPHDLLHRLQQAETDLGRVKSFPKGPRSIDLDILLYDCVIMKTDDLTIPHPEIKNREFIMKHLIELDPDIIDPLTGKKYRDIP